MEYLLLHLGPKGLYMRLRIFGFKSRNDQHPGINVVLKYCSTQLVSQQRSDLKDR